MNDMASDVNTDEDNGLTAAGTPRKRRPQAPAQPRPAFLLVRAKDGDGNIIQGIDRKNVEILAVERSPERILEMLDSAEYAGAFYMRFMVPPGR